MWTGRVHLFLLYTRYLPAGKCSNMSSKISINSHTWILKKTTEDFVSDIHYFSISWIIFSHLVCNVLFTPAFSISLSVSFYHHSFHLIFPCLPDLSSFILISNWLHLDFFKYIILSLLFNCSSHYLSTFPLIFLIIFFLNVSDTVLRQNWGIEIISG